MFKNSSPFWNWLFTSSGDPTQVAVTAKGIVIGILPALMVFIHAPSLTNLPDDVYSLVVALFTLVAAAHLVYGLLRKIFFPTDAFVASLKAIRPTRITPDQHLPPSAPPGINM
jgi:hypothetical protein